MTVIPEADISSTDDSNDGGSSGDSSDDNDSDDDIGGSGGDNTGSDDDGDVEVDYFKIYVNSSLVRTLYRYRKRGNKFGIGKIRIRKGDSIQWKYYQDGILVSSSQIVKLDGNSRKELIVLYLELMYIYHTGNYDYEDD